MKTIILMFYIVLFSTNLFFISSCSKSDELSRNEAATLIKQKYSLPSTEVKDINLGYENEHFTMQRYDKLESMGLMNTNHYLLVIMSSKLTNEGKKYAVGNVKHDYISGNNIIQVKVATLEFGEITGIIERKEFNVAEVNYTLIRKDITPFGKVFNINEGVTNRTAIFTKYDDGWRIK